MSSPKLPRLRAYRAADAPFVELLARKEFGEYSLRAGAPTVRAAAEPGVVAIVAVVADVPVGFAMMSRHDSGRGRARGATTTVASIDAIAVDAAHRGRGVGKALLRAAEREAKERGVAELRLVTAESNLGALDLFLRFGFEIVERRSRYYPRGQNAVIMRKVLVL